MNLLLYRVVAIFRKPYLIFLGFTGGLKYPALSLFHPNSDIKEYLKYIEDYNQCQRMKNRAKIPVGKLIPNIVLEKL